MSPPQYIPIPPELLALACETVTRRVSRLPFLRSSILVTEELLGVTLECLNAEATKSLALTTPKSADYGGEPGLDKLLEARLTLQGTVTSPVIAEVLRDAGIGEPAEILEKHLHQVRRGIRLLPAWTWHIAKSAVAPTLQSGNGAEGAVTSSWMSLCPVCRTGILNKAVGKQLFGIPHTDFIIECTHCGAKFIPVGTAYRLVSIATIRDPLWKKLLDKTYPAETWAGLAHGTSPGGNPLKRREEPRSSPSGQPALITPTLVLMKDGSLMVPVEEKTLYFKPLPLTFSGGVKRGAYTRVQKTVAELIENPAFIHLRDLVNARYSRYLPLKAGLFLAQLEERHDPSYREFLNPYGDERYGSFRTAESGLAQKSGILLVVVKNRVYCAVPCRESFQDIVNKRLGRILPEDCLVDGDALRCRINAVLCNNRQDTGFFVHECDDPGTQDRIAAVLNRKGIAGAG